MTSRMMASVRSKDSKAEIALRRELHRRGLRYRIHERAVFGHPDLVFAKAKIAVFVDGDFWHGNAWRVRGLDCLEDLFPNNTEFWVKKISHNIERDFLVNKTLADQGWQVVRVWESEIIQDIQSVSDRVESVVRREGCSRPERD